jgi:pimeloyl-ACP methyl ester carboxylesterase
MGKRQMIIAAGVAGAVLVLLLVTWLVLRRGDISYATLEQRWAAPGSHYVDLPGGEHVHYLDQGNPKGPTVVLLHGFAMSTDTWAAWTQKLGRDYRVIALDLPGYGLTRAPGNKPYSYQAMADVVEAFAQAKHLGKVVVAGSSMGGGVAWRYALSHPERVRGLVLVDSSGWPEVNASVMNNGFVKAGENPVLRPILTQLDNGPTMRMGFRTSFADPSRVDAAYLKRYVDLSRAPGRRAIWFQTLGDWLRQDFATPERLAAIKAPTLILWGQKDQLLPLADGRKFVADIPGAHLIVYPGVGHLPQEEAADRSAGDVIAFLRAIEPPAKKSAAPAAAAAAASTAKKPDPIFY